MIKSGVIFQLQKLKEAQKKRKFEDGSHSASSQANVTDTGEDDYVTNRSPGVKASKGRGKKPTTELECFFQTRLVYFINLCFYVLILKFMFKMLFLLCFI